MMTRRAANDNAAAVCTYVQTAVPYVVVAAALLVLLLMYLYVCVAKEYLYSALPCRAEEACCARVVLL